jgi:hypothetical protein
MRGNGERYSGLNEEEVQGRSGSPMNKWRGQVKKQELL